jgi:phosphoribosylglycinamide formyltransferase 1
MAASDHHAQLRFGVISSTNGSTFEALVEITHGLPIPWYLITDRPCGIEVVANRHRIPASRIEERDNHAFCTKAASVLKREGTEAVLLLFWRLVTAEVFSQFPTFNLHPSLLPEFPGLDAVTRARASGAGVLGTTLHVVSEKVDQGRIIAQTCDNVDLRWAEAAWLRVSFRQRVRLAVYLIGRLLGSGERHQLSAAAPITNIALMDAGLARAADAWIEKYAPLLT